jgi:calcium permeable stress-gated cation channel
VRAEEEATTTTAAPEPAPSHDGDTVVRDYANAFASSSHQRSSEDGSLPSDDVDSSPPERVRSPSFTNESRSSSPSPSAKPMEDEGPTDFSHPAAVEAQRIIWLPRDHLGLVHDLGRDLDSRGILHSTEGAEMNGKGHVNVIMAPPEEVQRSAVPLPSPDDEEVNDMRATSSWVKGSGSNKV